MLLFLPALVSAWIGAGSPVDAQTLMPPTSCSVVATATSNTVTWPAGPGAAEYVVYRSVDGGPIYWRGRVAGLSFVDSTRTGRLQYYVASRAANGAVSSQVACTTGRPFVTDVVAVGDMATCGADEAPAVSALLDTLPGTILGVGDYAYPDGTQAEYDDCFDPKFGRHRSRMVTAVGNHEYHTKGAVPYFGYFGAAAGDPKKGYFTRTIDGWQVIVLNSNCGRIGGCGQSSAQYRWLEAQLAAAPGLCRIAVVHHPRWSSWSNYSDGYRTGELLELLHGAGTDIVLTGHAHQYERLIQLDPAGVADPANGFTQFTIGTGGVSLRSPVAGELLPSSAFRSTNHHGALALSLDADSYQWRFLATTGAIVDSGGDTCVN